METQSKNKIYSVESEKIKMRALEKMKKKVVIVDTNELAEAEAHKAGDSAMTESKGSAGFLKKLWKHTFFDEYYRQKEVSKARGAIDKTGDIYAGREKEKNAHENAMQGIVDRFASDYEGTLSEGEDKKILDEDDEDTVKTRLDIKKLIIDYAKGSIDEEIFKNEKVKILDGLKNQNILGCSKNYADNLFEIAQNARLAIEHGAKMEELDFDLGIIIGKAKSSLKTEAHFNLVDKTIDKMKKTTLGRIISPAVLSTSVGLAYSLTVGLGTFALRSKAAAYGTFGAAVGVSSVFAGLNESQRVTLERKQHGLEMAEGGSFEKGSKRREQVDTYQYKMENSTGLSQELYNSLYNKNKEGKDEIKDIQQEDLDKIFANLSNIEARTALNDKKKIDLISYSGIGNVEKERTELTILVAKAKVELRKKLEGDLKNSLPKGETFDSYLAKQIQIVENTLLGGESGIENKDKAFSKYKTKRVASKIVANTLIGLSIGGVVQEGLAFFKDDTQGLLEGMFKDLKGDNIKSQTPLEYIRGWITGEPSHTGLKNAVETSLNGHNFKLPEGANILQNADGTFDILKNGEIIADDMHLNFDVNGNLDEESIGLLGEAGIVTNTTHNIIDSTKEINSNAENYVQNHQSSTTHVVRDGWYDNDTPKPIFDKNELKLHWGGVDGSGMNEQGDFVFNINQMKSDGSFHKGFSVDAQDKIKNGGIKMILSLTREMQHWVFEVPVDINGNAVIEHDSEIGKLFFDAESGRADFNGAFAEVVETFSSSDGSLHVKTLATLVGEGNDSIIDTVATHVDNVVTSFDLPLDTDPPMFIPILPRNPLEKLTKQEASALTYYMDRFGYLGKESSEDRITKSEFFEKNRSITLKENPNAKLDQYKEIETYLNNLDADYLERIKVLVDQTEKMGKDCKLSACIPVAGHQEGKQIYESLENYTYQTANKDEFEIVLFVNHPEKDKTGNILNATETLNEIERFKKDHPEIKVRVMYEVLDNGEARIGLIRKMLSDATLIRQHERGENAPDLIMVSNDADNKGVDPRYIQAFIDKFEKNPKVDGLLGQIDWDPESYQKYPAIHIGTRLFQYLSIEGRSNSGRMVSSGANSAYRSSIYAGIGGYMDSKEGGEDVAIGEAIVAARGGNTESFAFAGSKTRLFTSSRRAISVFLEYGLAPVEQWDKGFSVHDDKIRKLIMKPNEKIDYDNPNQIKKLKKEIESVINRTVNVFEAGEKVGKATYFYRKALSWMDIDFVLNDKGDIVITDTTSLIKNLKKYQTQGELIRDARSGKPKAISELKILREDEEENDQKEEGNNNKKNKIKKETEMTVEEMEKVIENLIDELPNNEQKIDKLNKILVKSLNNDFLKKIEAGVTIKEIKDGLEKCKKIQTGADFIWTIKGVLRPLTIALNRHPGELANFKRKVFVDSHNFNPINEVFSYSIDGGVLHLHMGPSKDISLFSKARFIKEGLEKLSKVVKSNKKIETIAATSWIVASNPGLLKRFGFKNEGPINDKIRERDFKGETQPISKATISREEFLSKYLKEEEKIGFIKKFKNFFGWKSKE